MVRLRHHRKPCFFPHRQPFRTIAALELLDSLVCILLFAPDFHASGEVGHGAIATAQNDSRGNAYVVAA